MGVVPYCTFCNLNYAILVINPEMEFVKMIRKSLQSSTVRNMFALYKNTKYQIQNLRLIILMETHTGCTYHHDTGSNFDEISGVDYWL